MSKFEYTDEMVTRMNDICGSGVTEDIIESLCDEFEFPRVPLLPYSLRDTGGYGLWGMGLWHWLMMMG